LSHTPWPDPDRRTRLRSGPRHAVRVGRVYDKRDDDRSCRVLVDRLWPRGMSKADAPFGEWLKEVAPSTELRRWYGHDVSRFREFARRYRTELRAPPASIAVNHLIDLARSHPVTLVTATRDVEHSAARVLGTFLATDRMRPLRATNARSLEKADLGRR
jgi:uncharacterized protein YeaO (DUF488 family)